MEFCEVCGSRLVSVPHGFDGKTGKQLYVMSCPESCLHSKKPGRCEWGPPVKTGWLCARKQKCIRCELEAGDWYF